jgi:hemolysin-activating ACP:hemolysin acyltransferase
MRQEARPIGLAAIEQTMSDTPPPKVRTFQNRAMALGLAVEYLMKKPAFAKLPFGHWSRVLTGQIRRGHYVFVIQGNKVVGFGGWAAATETEAEAWLAGQPNATEISGSGGDCAVINAWAADGPEVNDMLVAEAMRRTEEFRMVYAKREYEDGRTRPVRMPTRRAAPAGGSPPSAT